MPELSIGHVFMSYSRADVLIMRLINRQFVDLRLNQKVSLASLETAVTTYLQEISGQIESNQQSLANKEGFDKQILDNGILKFGTDNTNTPPPKASWSSPGNSGLDNCRVNRRIYL